MPLRSIRRNKSLSKEAAHGLANRKDESDALAAAKARPAWMPEFSCFGPFPSETDASPAKSNAFEVVVHFKVPSYMDQVQTIQPSSSSSSMQETHARDLPAKSSISSNPLYNDGPPPARSQLHRKSHEWERDVIESAHSQPHTPSQRASSSATSTPKAPAPSRPNIAASAPLVSTETSSMGGNNASAFAPGPASAPAPAPAPSTAIAPATAPPLRTSSAAKKDVMDAASSAASSPSHHQAPPSASVSKVPDYVLAARRNFAADAATAARLAAEGKEGHVSEGSPHAPNKSQTGESAHKGGGSTKVASASAEPSSLLPPSATPAPAPPAVQPVPVPVLDVHEHQVRNAPHPEVAQEEEEAQWAEGAEDHTMGAAAAGRVGLSVVEKHNVQVIGHGPEILLFSHGFGSNWQIWGQTVEAMGLDLTHTNPDDFDFQRYSSLHGYADDLLELLDELDIKRPHVFKRMILLGASPRYTNGPDYTGGFTLEVLDQLFAAVQDNYRMWASGFAPIAVGCDSIDSPHVREFSRTLFLIRPDIAFSSIKTIFLCDMRYLLPQVSKRAAPSCPSEPLLHVSVDVHLLQTEKDNAVPLEAMEYMVEHLPKVQYEMLPVEGHLPHLTHPKIVADALLRHLASPA
eukprot:jgi/Mesen1/8342/ME000462S07791